MAEKTALPTIPLLTGDNYFNWRVKMESVLQLKRLVNVLTLDRPTGDDKKKEKEEWDEKNADVIACIRLSLSDSQILQFASEKNAKRLWKAIHDTYAGPAEDRAIDAGEELKNIKMLDNETVNEYISRARGLGVKCVSAGLNVSERQLVYNVVRGLHKKYDQIREILKTQRDKKLDEILEILREKERETLKKGNNSGLETAYATKNPFKKNYKRKCFICGKTNHLAKDCYHRKNRTEKETSERYFKDKKDSGKGNQRRNVNLASEDRLDYATFQVFDSGNCLRNQNKWIIDSGCTSHMTFERKYFLDFKSIKGKVYLAGKDNVLESSGIGSLRVKIQNEKGKIIYVTVYDVIYVPKLRSNLLSVMKLMERGLKVNFAEYEVKICKENGQIIATGERIDNHFVTHMIPIIENNCNSVYNNEVGDTDDEFSRDLTHVWHRRLGHVNDKYIQRLTREKLAYGINNDIKDTNCKACKTCKITRKTHKSVVHDQSKRILDLLHLDICGPMPVESVGGSRYILLIIDDYSDMFFTYFLKNKTETLSLFQIFYKKCKNVLDKNIKCIRTDNGTEFCNNQFREFTGKKGIEHQKTVPYNPESNGKVERGNRVILERARTLLYESGLPLSFWAEAVAYVTHAVNLTPRKNKSKTPYEIWNGKVPNISYLRTFGCIAYYHVPKNLRNKLQPSGKKAIMLGYSRERVGYRLFDIESKIIIEERNVNFDEIQKGSYYLKEFNRNKEYEYWNIEDIINILDDNKSDNSNNNNSDREVEFDNQRENSEIESINDSDDNDIQDNVESIDDQNEEENRVQNREIVRRGRPKGLTAGESLRRKEEYLAERETRLREEGVRRSARLKNVHHAQLVENIPVPRNFNEAHSSKNWENWKDAMENELASLNKHDVWETCKCPKGVKIVKSKWVFSIKRDGINKVKYKARLVAAGYNQVKNQDYDESYSPVVSIEAWRTIIAIAVKKNLNIRFFDVKTAYLHGRIKETVYLKPPPGFEERFEDGKVCKLKRSLYGLPQSGRNWYYKLKEELFKNGLKPLASESCIFINNNETCFFVFTSYVDDFTTIDDDSHICEKIFNSLRKEFEIIETTQSKTFFGNENRM